MTKHSQKFERIEKAKDRYRKLPSAKILELLNSGYINEEGQIAYREVLQERGEWPLDISSEYAETRLKLDEIEKRAYLGRKDHKTDEDDT